MKIVYTNERPESGFGRGRSKWDKIINEFMASDKRIMLLTELDQYASLTSAFSGPRKAIERLKLPLVAHMDTVHQQIIIEKLYP